MISGKLLLLLCFPHLANLVHLLVLMFHACLWSKYSHFSLITFFWVKIEVRSKQNQLISGCIKGVMLRHPWSAFTLLPCLPVSSKHISAIFIYSLPHSLFYLIQSTFSPLSPNALSANNLKFVCHCGERGTAHPITFILLPQVAWFITPHIESDQKPIEFQSNICISASSVWFNCQCCQSCLCCYLPEPCHSSMPCNLVSRFTV